MKGWKEVKLGDCIDFLNGFAFKSAQFTDDKNDSVLIKGENIGKGIVHWEISKYWNVKKEEKERLSKFILKPNDILLAMDRPWVSGGLKYAYLKESDPQSLLVQRVCCLRANEIAIQGFLRYIIASETFSIYIKNLMGGVAVPHISPSQIKGYKFFLPLPSIQQKIASILSAYDDLIENNLKRIKLLEETAQRTYEEWFVKDDIPEDWSMIKVGDLLAKMQSTKKINTTEYKSIGQVPIIDQGKDFIAGYTDDEDAIISSELPIIVFGDHTRILKFINFSFARGADGTQLIKSSDSKRMPQHLFFQSLLNVDLSNYHYARHFKFLKELEIILPDQKIAQQFENFVKPQYDLISNFTKQNRLFKEARDILLPGLLTGVISV